MPNTPLKVSEEKNAASDKKLNVTRDTDNACYHSIFLICFSQQIKEADLVVLHIFWNLVKLVMVREVSCSEESICFH